MNIVNIFVGFIMAKFHLRTKARELRRQGVSVRSIATQLNVARSSASIWVRDIVMTVEQLEHLRNLNIIGGERGRLKGALMQKQRWLNNMEEYRKRGAETIGSLTNRELLIAGIALYWGEGSKKDRRVQFCNSDPKMIQFLLYWLRVCLGITKDDIHCRVGINISHAHRDTLVKEYWSKISGIPLSHFVSTSLKKVESKKVYDNMDEHYGTLSVQILKSSRYYAKIIGLIEGLASSVTSDMIVTNQGSSMVEHHIHNVAAMGSSPIPGTKKKSKNF